MASVRVSFPSDLEGMLRSEIWNYKTDPPHNGAGFSFCSPRRIYSGVDPSLSDIRITFSSGGVLFPFFHFPIVPFAK